MERKHRLQMTNEEICFVETLVHSMSGWQIVQGHTPKRMNERSIAQGDILEALMTGRVIELNDFGRVLMRSTKGVCVVADIKRRFVVTTWFNRPGDNHSTLDRSQYKWHVNVITYVQQLRGKANAQCA